MNFSNYKEGQQSDYFKHLYKDKTKEINNFSFKEMKENKVSKEYSKDISEIFKSLNKELVFPSLESINNDSNQLKSGSKKDMKILTKMTEKRNSFNKERQDTTEDNDLPLNELTENSKEKNNESGEDKINK